MATKDFVKIDKETEEKAQQVLEKYDKESRFRKYAKGSFYAKLITVIAVSMSLFHLYTAGFGLLPALQQRAVHLGFVMVLIFLLYPGTKKSSRLSPSVFDIILTIGSAFVLGYLIYHYNDIVMRGATPNSYDLVVGGITLLLVLEATRRTIGMELPILAIVFVAYAFLGQHMPGILNHRGYGVSRIIEQLYLTDDGLFSIALDVSSTYIFLFILFGAFLAQTGLGQLINDISMAIAGRSPGGPAKVAVVASGLMGTISGAAAANVATTGAFTIPLMKRIGYKPYFAGAVEAVASTGGQIMPPVMGAAAFILAQFLSLPYATVMLAGIIPAVLYYVATWTMVHLEARRLGLQGLPKDQLPKVWDVLKARGHLLIPLVAIVYLLLKGYTPLFAGFYGILITVASSWLRKDTRIGLNGIITALEQGARGAVSVAIACAVVGFIIGVVALTSLGMVMAMGLVEMAGNSLLLILFLTMLICIVLGMGLPTSPAYIIAATVAAPALVKLGVEPLAAHFFVFYYACLSTVTPPVALAAYTGAGIAGASPSQVGWTAFRLAIAGFIIPYMFVYSPVLLLQHPNIGETILALITATIGVVGLGASVQNYLFRTMSLPVRALLLAGSLMLIKPGLVTDLIGIAILVLIYIYEKIMSGKDMRQAKGLAS